MRRHRTVAPGLRGAPPRVYLVCSELPPDVVGGLGRYAERMIDALATCGTPIEVFGLAGVTPVPRRQGYGDVTVHRIATTPAARRAPDGAVAAGVLARLAVVLRLLSFNIQAAMRILRADAGRTGSVVAVHDWMGCVAGVLCGVLGRRRVVFHVHTNELTAGTSWRHRSLLASGIAALEGLQARVAHRVVVPSAAVRDSLAARGWEPARIRVVHHGFEDREVLRLTALPAVERERLRTAVRCRYLRPPGSPLVVFAGRLSPHKGVATLLHAVPYLVRRHPGVRVVVIGRGSPLTDEDGEVARLVTRLGLEQTVVLVPVFLASPELYAHFLAADVCVFPSTYEPFGLAAVEAMALSRPVVLGPGFAPEVAGVGGRSTLQSRQDCPEELAGLVLECLDDAPGAERRGALGRLHAQQHFSWARTVEQTLAAYAEGARA